MEIGSSRLDGNAIAGALSEIFVGEMTEARVACGGCGSVEPIGAEHAYLRAPGAVVRCCHCEAVVLVLIEAPARRFISFEGRWMAVSSQDEGSQS